MERSVKTIVYTCARKVNYLKDTLQFLSAANKGKIIVSHGGAEESNLQEAKLELEGLNVELYKVQHSRLIEGNARHNASTNYVHSLRIVDVTNCDYRLILEDDVKCAKKYPEILQEYIKQIESVERGKPFALTLYSHARYGVHGAQLNVKKIDIDKDYKNFSCTQACVFSERICQGLSNFIEENIGTEPHDWLIGKYCQQEGINIWAVSQSLFQHVGEETTGLGDYHQATNFYDDVKPAVHLPKANGVSLEKISSDIKKCLGHVFEFNENDGEVLLQHFHGQEVERSYAKKIIIQPVDGSLITEDYICMINKYDLVLTPSTPCKKILEDCGVTAPIIVVPNWYDPEIFVPESDYFQQLFPEPRYTFYSESSGIERKNVGLLVRGFLRVFSDQDGVRLIVKTATNNVEVAELKQLIKRKKDAPEIHFITEHLEEPQLRSLMRGADCYVCVSHVEGFGIPVLNAAALNKDIIATDSWMNGYLDFLTPETAILLETTPFKMALTEKNMLFYHPDALWERPITASYQRALRQCYEGTYHFRKGVTYPEYSREHIMKHYYKILCEALEIEQKDWNEFKSGNPALKDSGKKLSVSAAKRIHEIKYVAARGSSGYAEAAKDYIIGLSQKMFVHAELLQLDNSDYISGERNRQVNALVSHKAARDTLIVHAVPDNWTAAFEKHSQAKKVGMTVWETDKLPSAWLPWIESADCVIVPCKWNLEVFRNSGVTKPIGVIPHIYREVAPIQFNTGIQGTPFVFYTIGQWTDRKGVGETIKAYLTAFTANDNVVLIVKTFKADYSDGEKKKIISMVEEIKSHYSSPAQIELILGELSDGEIAHLHEVSHCYVSLCKAEGFGLGAFEAAGRGKPVVTTGYGAPVEFLPGPFVEYSLGPVEMDYTWYTHEHNWAYPSVEHGAELLKEFYLNYTEHLEAAQKNSIRIKRNFDSAVITQRLINFLNEKEDFMVEYEREYSYLLGRGRDAGFRMLFDEMEHLVLSGKQLSIVETGCLRIPDNWDGDGQSSYLFDRFLHVHPECSLEIFDNDEDAVSVCNEFVSHPNTVVRLSDSVAGLKERTEKIDVLYLDSYDVDFDNIHPSALHHLKELTAAMRLLTPGALVMVDDNVQGKGKGAYVRDFMDNIGAEILHDGYQILFRLPE